MDNFKVILNKESKRTSVGIAEGSLRQIQKGSFIQIERKGFYYVDKLELGDHKITLNYTPDGKAKNDSTKKDAKGAPPNKAANKAAAAAAAGGGAEDGGE